MEEQQRRKKRRQRRNCRRMRRLKKIILIMLLAALLMLLAWLHLDGVDPSQLQINETSTASPATETTEAAALLNITKLEIDPDAAEFITPTPAATEPGVAIPGWGRITLPAGEIEVQISMQNPEANADWYDLSFELRLRDTDEVIFTTERISPGQYCNHVTLTRAMEPGEYAAVIHVQPYRISDQTPTNNANLETVLVVE